MYISQKIMLKEVSKYQLNYIQWTSLQVYNLKFKGDIFKLFRGEKTLTMEIFQTFLCYTLITIFVYNANFSSKLFIVKTSFRLYTENRIISDSKGEERSVE